MAITDRERHPPVERTIDELPDDDHPLFGSDDLAGAGHHHVVGRARRSDRHRRRRTRRRRRIAPILAVVLILVVVAGSIVALGKVRDRFAVADYTGNGQGFVRIAVQPGDGAEDIAASLVKVGAVKSARAFVNAAKKSGQAGDIQPGTYQVRLHSSGAAAMAAILDPANRLVSKVTIAEGRTEKQILAELAAKTGIGIADLNAASKQLGSLGLPPGYSATTAEGFLFPATYDFDPNDTAETELQSLTAQFAAETAKLDFVASAKSLGVTPYQALIVASLVESEAKFDQDRGKIARVIYNRLAAKMPIGIDAANRYGLAVLGKDPNSVTFKENSPYNVRLRTGLPPTPISNPGINSLKAAVNPDAGNWLYYVVSDAAGHHFFTNDPNAFEAARQKCQANGWGC
ncbi:MAG: hypothetical protein QOK10_3189 [Pseudonocardiales bacterium]|nr:hypothetical protein [Pseudonocardiales bacterium]